MSSAKGTRSGMALLEVLVGIFMLAVSGVAWVLLVRQDMEMVRQTKDRERRTREAAGVLERLSQWRGSEPLSAFERQMSASGLVVSAERSAPRLWTVVIRDSSTGRIVLRTAFYLELAPNEQRAP